MSLELPHRWEHALIAATVKAASAKCPNCDLGRTAIQKLLYFMNVSGVPMAYTFDIHHYGPFCQSVMSDVEWLLADSVIVDRSQNESHHSNYKPGPGLAELEVQYKDGLGKYRPIVENVCSALSDLSANTLELIATLDFSFRWVRARGGQGPWRQEAIQKFKEIKQGKFADTQIEYWYGALVGAKLISE